MPAAVLVISPATEMAALYLNGARSMVGSSQIMTALIADCPAGDYEIGVTASVTFPAELSRLSWAVA